MPGLIPRLPPAFPAGWYVLARSAEIGLHDSVTRRFVGRHIVLSRGSSGVTAVTPDSSRLWPVREQNGVVMVFHDALGRDPTWEVPLLPEEGYSAPLWRKVRFRGHPQETSENSADLGHFSAVHGYLDVTLLSSGAEGTHFNTRMKFVRPRDVFGLRRDIRAEMDVHVHGLGFSFVDVFLPDLKLHTRQLVLSTPVEHDRVEVLLGMAVGTQFDPGALHPLARLVPRPLLLWVIRHLSILSYVGDVNQDIPIWERKSFVDPPALAAGDGPIGRYRQWARQFYADRLLAAA